jgi:hypothetical protein
MAGTECEVGSIDAAELWGPPEATGCVLAAVGGLLGVEGREIA